MIARKYNGGSKTPKKPLRVLAAAFSIKILAMRLLGAALFVMLGAFGVTSIFVNSANNLPYALQVVMVVAFSTLLVLSMIIFDESRQSKSAEKYMAELEEKGLIEDTNFSGTRAFEVEEWDDLGLNYFVELADGSVLFLQGQYLYDYQKIDDDPEFNQPRTFPCREFTLRRHRTKKHILDIVCHGEVIEPECVAPTWSRDDFCDNIIPKDGTIIRDRTYDEIKAERLQNAK